VELTLNDPVLSPVRSEAALVEAARQGDDRAFEHLYTSYRDRIYAFILSKVRDHGRAEDLCQEVFMSALRQLRACDQTVQLKPWLYTIAKNACIDEFRRGARTREVPIESGGELTPGAVSSDRLLSALPTPAAAIESKQSLDDLRGAFGGLSDSQHRLLVLREFEGLSYDEIGTQLGMTKQMVESGLFRARRKLGEEYDELASGRRCEQIQSAIDGGQLQSARRLGIKDRRRASRHLAHCQPCRHVAMMTGVDAALLKPRSIADRIAALLPFGLLRRRWPFSGRSRTATGAAGHHAAVGGGAAGVAGSSAGAGIGSGSAAAVAVLALAGAGGGLALATHSGTHHRVAPAVRAGHHATARQGGSGAVAPLGLSGVRSGTVRSSGGSVSSPGTAGSARARRGAARTTGRGRSGVGSARDRATTASSGASGHSPTSSSHPGSTSTTSGGTGSGTGATGVRSSGSTSAGASTVDKAAHGTKATVSKAVSGGSSTTKSVASGVGTTVKSVTSGVGSTVTKTASGVGSTVTKTASGVGSTVTKTASGVGSTVTKTASGVGSTVTKTASGVGSTVTKTASGVGSTVTKTASGVGSTVTKTASGLGTTANSIVPGAGTTVTNTGTTAGTKVSAAGSAVGRTVTSTGSAVGRTVTSTGSAVGRTVTSTGSAVGTTVTKVGSTVGSVLSGLG
jgi:RNA polymerase sigma factor (sigma-70 family)